MLYEDYGIYYGELSCEVVENYNKVVCKFLEYGTNHRETICGAPTGNETEASLWDNHERKAAFVNNKYFQTMRHVLDFSCKYSVIHKLSLRKGATISHVVCAMNKGT